MSKKSKSRDQRKKCHAERVDKLYGKLVQVMDFALQRGHSTHDSFQAVCKFVDLQIQENKQEKNTYLKALKRFSKKLSDIMTDGAHDHHQGE